MSDPSRTPINHSNHNQPDSIETQPEPIADKQTPINHQRSTWAYIKWVLWTTIASLFDCSAPTLTAPVDNNTWPSSSGSTSSRHSRRDRTRKLELNPTQDQNCLIQPALNSQPVSEQANCVCEVYPNPNCTYTELLTASIDILNDPSETVEFDLLPLTIDEYLCEYSQDLGGIPLSQLACSQISSEHLLIDDHSSLEFINQGSFTLINSLNADAINGLIDTKTRDLFIKQILDSVIPRNLSDSSEVRIPPDARKMYAWTKAPEIEPDTNDGEHKTKFDLEMNSTTSDDQSAEPGSRTLSDHSFSPLSPSTMDGAAPIDEFLCKSMERPHDLGLPKVDRSDQTLAWAMSNLQMNLANESKHQPDFHTPDENHAHYSQTTPTCLTNPSDKTLAKSNSSNRPPLPSSHERPSRDRSPANKCVPNKITDPTIMSTFMPFDGAQIFESSNQSNATEIEITKPKRSSSLKSSRTPPGTPVQKAVRFADALGLDLTTVRHVFDSEAPPKIPASATFDLQLDSDESIAKIGAKQFGLCFAQPGLAANFIRHVLTQTVCLEDAHIDMPRGVLTGTIRVKSLGFEKRVFVRITYNNWITFCDSPASYVHGSYDGATDRFAFSIIFPDTMVPGDKAMFAIRYETHAGDQYWDNNHGQNYAVTCYAKATDLAGDGSWVHFL